MQNTTIPTCPEKLLVLWICSCMLYSSKHVAGHQGLINPDVSFNNVLLLSWSTVTDTRIHGPKANCTNCSAYIQEKIAIIHNVLTNQYTHDPGLITKTSAPCYAYHSNTLSSAVLRLTIMRTQAHKNLQQLPAGIVSFPAECVFKIMCRLVSPIILDKRQLILQPDNNAFLGSRTSPHSYLSHSTIISLDFIVRCNSESYPLYC